MAIETINIGTSPNDGTGDPLRVAFDKINDNFLNVTTDGGDEITVLNPTTATDTTLNTALADLASGGGAVDSVNSQTGVVSIDLQSVTDEGNETTNPIKVADIQIFNSPDGDYVKIYANENELIFDNLVDTTKSFALDKSVLTSSKAYSLPDETGFFQIVSSNKTANFNAKTYSFYTANGTLTVTDPTADAGQGYIVHVIGGTSTIGGVAYTSGALVYRYYDGASWISTNMAGGGSQDIDSVLAIGDIAVDKVIELTSSTTTNNTLLADNGLYVGDNATESIQISKDKITRDIITNVTDLVFTDPTANRVITFKDESGTVALLSDIGGVGATQNARATRLELTSDINLPISVGGSVSVVDFDNTVFNVDPTVFTNNGSGTITCTLAGNYLVTTSIVLESPLASAITKSELGIRKNGTNIICATTDDTPIALGNNIRSLTTSTIINLSANDTLQAVVNLFGASATGRGLRLPSLFGTTATQVSNISIERLEVSEFDVDATPTDGSSNAVSSNGVFDSLALKQDELWDFKTKKGFQFFEDFMSNPDNSNITSDKLSYNGGGAGFICQQTLTYPTGNVFGVLQMATGTTTTGVAQVRYGRNTASTQEFGKGVMTFQTYVNIETLSDVTNRFWDILGFTSIGNPALANSISFIYDEGAQMSGASATPNFQCVTSISSVRTFTTTAVPVVASQWYKLTIVINANATSVQFFIDNTLVATHTTNIPTSATARVFHQKTTGTTSRNVFVDYFGLKQSFTTARL